MKFEIVYADPPWLYENRQDGDSRRGGFDYPPMTMGDLKALPVAAIAAPDAALFLWAVYPKLPEAISLMESWQFSYRTVAFTWVKMNPSGRGIYSGLGYWTNGNAEIVLFGKRGHPMRSARDVKQIVLAPRGRHSAKPPEVRDRIVALMGDRPRIELFARETAPRWISVGNEIDGRDIRDVLREMVDGGTESDGRASRALCSLPGGDSEPASPRRRQLSMWPDHGAWGLGVSQDHGADAGRLFDPKTP